VPGRAGAGARGRGGEGAWLGIGVESCGLLLADVAARDVVAFRAALFVVGF